MGVTHGLRDAILGTIKVYNMDKDLQKSPSKKPTEPLTTLARRRAEKRQESGEMEKKKESEPKVMNRILLCCAWNGGLFWLSIFIFYGAVIPSLQYLIHLLAGSTASAIWGWIGPILSWTFSALWILPIFILSKIVNALWFQDIADAAYRRARGRPVLPSLHTFVADLLFSVTLQVIFLLQGMLASLLPIHGVGAVVSQLHMCLLYSLYSFEYKWFNMSWPVHKRLCYIENNWPYFVGFGLPLAVLTSLPESFIVSGCVFSILFPLFIISANEAESIHEIHDMPLRLFAPSAKFTNNLFHRPQKSTVPSSGHSTPASTPKKRTRIMED